MVKRGWNPAIDRMATVTLRAEFTGMRLSLRVTGGAVLGCAFEYATLMTTFAGNCSVFAVEVEGKG